VWKPVLPEQLFFSSENTVTVGITGPWSEVKSTVSCHSSNSKNVFTV
jgi:hypothetical protein